MYAHMRYIIPRGFVCHLRHESHWHWSEITGQKSPLHATKQNRSFDKEWSLWFGSIPKLLCHDTASRTSLNRAWKEVLLLRRLFLSWNHAYLACFESCITVRVPWTKRRRGPAACTVHTKAVNDFYKWLSRRQKPCDLYDYGRKAPKTSGYRSMM